MPIVAHGKMYKRYTFDNLAPSLGTRTGFESQGEIISNTQTTGNEEQEMKVRNKLVVMRMNDDEFCMLQKLQKESTERNVSNYLRKVALQKPVIIKYRNQTADDFLKDMIPLKKELNEIGNNLIQAIQKLQMLDRIPEFRVWINSYHHLQQSVAIQIQEINSRINQLYNQWLQK